MGVHRTCGEPNEIKKNTHPKNVTLSFVSRPWQRRGAFQRDNYVSLWAGLARGSTVQLWKGEAWYETDEDCAKAPADEHGCGGKAVTGNLTDIVRLGGHCLCRCWCPWLSLSLSLSLSLFLS